MQITIKYFGLIADITSKKEEVFTFVETVITTEDILKRVQQKYTDLNDTTFVIAVNKTIATTELALTANDTVALLPPFAGG